MFKFDPNDRPRPHCLFTNVHFRDNINLDQPPLKKPPFTVISKHRFSHTLEILLPAPALPSFLSSLAPLNGTLHYAKVHMKLIELISGDFFTQYIKSGTITMLSSGRASIDPLFTLSSGVLRLEIDTPTFERLGLPGHPIPHAYRKHIKARFAVELDLRQPSMVRGRPGFERIVRAFERVLDQTVTWLVTDMRAGDGSRPIEGFQPVVREVEGRVVEMAGVEVPGIAIGAEGEGKRDGEEEGARELLEWVTLAMSGSPRVRDGDRVEPVLCRYRVPESVGDGREGGEGERKSVQDLVKVSWRGLITPEFVHKVFVAALKVSTHRWMGMSVAQFNGEGYVFLFRGQRGFVWEYRG